ncbi:hypothetical protein EHS25_009054 [Saitozyma podzolica]|uniref:Uncharacterized protein n=1 Tax=Saitozyma podzolica TaxID=1890683 RepID=A0A427YKQ7_9TREE|nr:hypothetical protein EHS25_009054 [Saitozyma podzolica]
MPPRKSTSRSSRPSQAAVSDAASQPVASSSKTTLDAIPPLSVPESITPEYVYAPQARPTLTEAERETLVHELVGFRARSLLDDISEHARKEIYNIVEAIEGWATQIIRDESDEYQRELDTGMYALETLLESHVDKAFEKFTAWVMRNPFDIPAELEPVLPWQAGLDFFRGEHVASHGGEDALQSRLEELRLHVEQARYLSQQFEVAEKTLDRRLEIAKQRKAEVGFVHEVIQSAGLTPLPQTAETLRSSLSQLFTSLEVMEIPIPSIPQSAPGTKAWELGRQAYLNWAVGKMVHPESAVAAGGGPGSGPGAKSEERMEGIEREMAGVGDKEAMEAMGRAAGV